MERNDEIKDLLQKMRDNVREVEIFVTKMEIKELCRNTAKKIGSMPAIEL